MYKDEIQQNKPTALPEYCNMYFDEAVKNWDEAIPLGNGLMGCLVWGDGQPLRMSLDRADLWDMRPAPETRDKDFTYSNLISLVKKGDQEGINDRYDKCYFRPTPTKIPAGSLEICFGRSADRVKSRLDLYNACSEIELDFGESYSSIKTYIHAQSLYGYIGISGDADLPVISVKSPEFRTYDKGTCDNDISESPGVSNGSLKQLKYPAVEWFEAENQKWFVQKTAEGMEYGVVLGIVQKDNSMEAAYFVGSSLDGVNWLDRAKGLVREALDKGATTGMESHNRWWADFWSISSVEIPEKEFERLWYISSYLFGSCSRKGFLPMTLQGVWTADNGELPPWKGDYHHDLNTQMSYYHYLKANHLEEGECFIDFLWNLVPQAQSFAQSFFDAPGICLPAVMDRDGGPLGGWPMYTLNLTNQIWLCKAFEDYWRVTGNKEFLSQKAYTYFKETAKCVMRWLQPGSNGKLELVLSSSPEIHDNRMEAWLCPNSNYDLALLKYLFITLFEMSSILENGEEKKWVDIYDALPEFAVDAEGRLMLSPVESLQESHRHFAQAMAIHPLRLLDYNCHRDKAIIDATIEHIEKLGMRQWVGFSFTWMAELYAVQGNGEAAAFQLKLFWENLCSQNGFHLNGDFMKRGLTDFNYRPFTLESNMCAADALQEMLLSTHHGVIKVFPAIPDRWSKHGVSFTGFRAENGFIVSAAVKNRKLEFIEIFAEHKAICRVYNSFSKHSVVLQKSDGDQIIECSKDEVLDIPMEKNEIIKLKLYMEKNKV